MEIVQNILGVIKKIFETTTIKFWKFSKIHEGYLKSKYHLHYYYTQVNEMQRNSGEI